MNNNENIFSYEKLSIYVPKLLNRFKIEYEKQDRSGVYGETQRHLAYNSNRIEGSTLTYNQTSSLFDTKTLSSNEEQLIRSKDVEEMNGHFVMFNNMLKTYNDELTEQLIKNYHYDLKIGVFEDKANGYPVGEYKNRGNRVSDIATASPQEVPIRMKKLLEWYNNIPHKTLKDLAEFHYKYETIHPFQDGNGRTGRIILFKECLKNNIFPFIVEDSKKGEYYKCLNNAQKGNVQSLVNFFKTEQQEYYKLVQDLILDQTQEPTPTEIEEENDDIDL